MSTLHAHQLSQLKMAPRRALIGVAIMLVSSMAGAVLVKRDQNTIATLQVGRAVSAGELITIADTRVVSVPAAFASAQWATIRDLAEPQRLTRSVRPGQLLYSTDFGASLSGEVVFAAAMDAAWVPVGVTTGSQVQLWSVGQLDDGESRLITSTATVVGFELGDGRDQNRLSLRIPPQFLADALQTVAEERLRLVSVE